MAAGGELTRDHQLFQIGNAAGVAVLEREIVQRYLAGAITGEQFVVAGSGAEFIGYRNAVTATERYMLAHRAVEAPELLDVGLVPAEFDLAGAMNRVMSTLGALDRVRELDRPQYEIDRVFARIVGNYATWAARAVQQASRDTIIASCDAASSRWRRVSDGNPCAWCAMLVGRGPVYRTRESAGRVVGRENNRGTAQFKATGELWYGGTVTRGARAGQDRTRGTRDIGEKFHDNCGCTVREVTGAWAPTVTEQGFVDLYADAVAKCEAEGLPVTSANVTRAMRELGPGVVHDAVETQTGGKGGGGKPLVPRAEISDGDRYPDDQDGKSIPFRPSEVIGLDESLEHILHGDPGYRSGGHLYSTVVENMFEGKIAFPQSWTEQQIEQVCRYVIGDATRVISRGQRFLLTATVDDVQVTVQVIHRASGPVVRTAHPDGGVGVMRVHNGALSPVALESSA